MPGGWSRCSWRNGEKGKGSIDDRDIREQNRLSWNVAVGTLDSHRGDLASFLREGGTTLFPEERTLLGNLEGKSLAHLQCNSGGDSVSLALLGARVTGVDISDNAVAAARELSRKSGVPVAFGRADLYDWLKDAGRRKRRFDVVFASYGVVCWLPDLAAWAEGIFSVLAPSGRFVLMDFHPVADMFDAGWRHVKPYPCGGERQLLEEGVGDYVGESEGGLTPAGFAQGVRGFENPQPAHLYRWGLGEMITALARSGLRILAVEEYPYSNGERHFSGMRELPGRRMVPPEGMPSVPLMYGISAEKNQAP